MKKINLEDLLIVKELGKGGEGTVYSIGAPYEHLVYKELKCIDKEKIRKVEALAKKNINNPFIALPNTLVLKEGECTGFLMPKVEGMEFSTSLTAFKPIFEKKLPNFKRKDLLEVSLDLIKKVKVLHQKGILIGDINPNNFMLNAKTREVYLIDCDSYQVDDLPCPVGTAEFTPPELQGIDFRNKLRNLNNELFAIGVMLFTVLMPGQKPYASKGGGEVQENIKNLNFPYPIGVEHSYKEPMGRWDLIWRQFDTELKESFYNMFKENKRISLDSWEKRLMNSYDMLLDEDIFPDNSNRILIDASSDWLGRSGLGKMRTTILKNMKLGSDKVAVIEISTRAVKMLIRNDMKNKEFSFDDFHQSNGGYREGILTRTGKGLKSDGNMDMNYFDENVTPALQKLVSKAINKYKVKHVYCVATAVIRSSKNKKDILNYIKDKFKINCRVLSKDEEAVLTTKAFRYTGYYKENGKDLLDNHENKKILFLDQGGGSTEFTLFENLDKNPIYSKSMNLGTTTLENAMYINSNKNTTLERAFEAIDMEIDRKLNSLFKERKKEKIDGCIAVGTAITKASNKKGNRNQHCYQLNIKQLKSKLDIFRNELIEGYRYVGDLKEAIDKSKNQNRGLDGKITTAIGLGAYIKIMEYYSLENLIISGTGLWYGIFYKGYEDIVLSKNHLAI